MRVLLVAALAITSAGIGFGKTGDEKIGKALQRTMLKAANPSYPILVYLKSPNNLKSLAAIPQRTKKVQAAYDLLRSQAMQTQAELIALLQTRGIKYRSFYLNNSIEIPAASMGLIHELAERSDVSKIRGDFPVRMLPKASPKGDDDDGEQTPRGIEGNVSRIGANRVWDEFTTGQGIVVAGQDTGIEWDHPALVNQYRGSTKGGDPVHEYNWYDAIREPIEGSGNPCGYATEAPCDDHGHGTHTIGTVVGWDGGSNQIGVAPGAKFIGCRNMDAGIGRPTTYLGCFQFFLAPFPSKGDPSTDGRPDLAPHVINNSWGCPNSEMCDGDEFVEVLDALKAAGILVVASAGNEGPGCSTIADAPAHHSSATLSVGAFDHRNNQIASFSSRGPSAFDQAVGPDVSAPGVSVRSCVPGQRYAGSGWSGTSMAGPHVVGAVALLWAASSDLIGQIDATVDLINQSAEPATSSQTCGNVPGSAHPNNTFGYGLLNIYNAVSTALR